MKHDAPPPRLALWLLDRLSGWGDDYGAAGDFEEYFRALVAERGSRRARRACWRQVGAALPGYLKNIIIWSDAMLKHYIRIAFRNLRKYKGYSFINIGGLALGIACTLFILLWVQSELSFDRFHAKAANLYRVEQDQDSPEGTNHIWYTPFPMGPALKDEIPQIEDFTRIQELGDMLFRRGENAFYESRAYAVDPQFLRMFTFPLIKGDPSSALGRPDALVITEDMAKKYFGAADPMGRTVTVDNARDFTVTGVLRNIPPNSTLSFDMLVPIDFAFDYFLRAHEMPGNTWATWEASFPLTYVRLNGPNDGAAIGQKITQLVGRNRTTNSSRFSLMPIVDIRLHGYGGLTRQNEARETVLNFSVIALFVLLIAGANFANLATARSANRALEIGLRKVVGARRKSLVAQHLAEAIVSALLAMIVSLSLVLLFLPAFNAVSGNNIALLDLANGRFLFGILAVGLLTGLLAGSYPAFFLSSFRPVRVLKGALRGGAGSSWFRKAMVLFQFGLSILLLFCMGSVARQIDYLRTKDLGYDKEQLICVPMRSEAYRSYGALKESLLQNPRIRGVTAIHVPPTRIFSATRLLNFDNRVLTDVMIRIAFVDFDFIETMKIELTAGRSSSRAMDNGAGLLVNEEIPRLMGLGPDEALGKRLSVGRRRAGTIVGVMKNFHYQSLRTAIEPLVAVVDTNFLRHAVIRLKAGEIPASLIDIRKAWNQVNPLSPFEYYFLDEDFDRMYRADERMGTLLKLFTAMAVLIACLGLFGLASFTAEQRTKEIGVRKVLGASSSGIVLLLSKEFAKWVLAANLLAWPAGYFLMRKWLQQYAYNTGIAWWLFAAAGAGALVIALATVSFQAVRASRINPAVTLKYE